MSDHVSELRRLAEHHWRDKLRATADYLEALEVENADLRAELQRRERQELMDGRATLEEGLQAKMTENKYVAMMREEEERYRIAAEKCPRFLAGTPINKSADWRAAAEAFEALVWVAKRYQAWEAKLLLCDEAWAGRATPVLTQELYDELLAIQFDRMAALRKAG